MGSSDIERAVFDAARNIAEIVFAADYYEGPWFVEYLGRRRNCTSYRNAKGWADYIRRRVGFAAYGNLCIGKIF